MNREREDKSGVESERKDERSDRREVKYDSLLVITTPSTTNFRSCSSFSVLAWVVDGKECSSLAQIGSSSNLSSNSLVTAGSWVQRVVMSPTTAQTVFDFWSK